LGLGLGLCLFRIPVFIPHPECKNTKSYQIKKSGKESAFTGEKYHRVNKQYNANDERDIIINPSAEFLEFRPGVIYVHSLPPFSVDNTIIQP
jgi:hypothetical protein